MLVQDAIVEEGLPPALAGHEAVEPARMAARERKDTQIRGERPGNDQVTDRRREAPVERRKPT